MKNYFYKIINSFLYPPINISKYKTFLRNATWGCGLVAGVRGRCVRGGWCHMLVCILLLLTFLNKAF